MKPIRLILFLTLILGSNVTFGQGYAVQPFSFNSAYSEYAPAFYDDGLVFCSNRKCEVFKTVLDEDEKFLTNIYFVPLGGSTKQGKPVLFSHELATAVNEGPLSFSHSGDTVFFTANLSSNYKNRRRNHLGIWMSTRHGEQWSSPESLEFNSVENLYDVAHPAVGPFSKCLIVSSNKPGGEGESDLYCVRAENGSWSEPENLGKKINTPGNELFPYFDAKGRLYFASNGRDPERSDLDIYFTEQDENGNWKTPVRMSEPINSEHDDFGIVIDQDGEHGFVSSNRNKGVDNIFEFSYQFPVFRNCEEIAKPPLCYLIEEEKIVANDTLPLVYEWDFDDGTTARGLSVEHCFPGVGNYEVALNLYDTITGMQYARVSEIYVPIEAINRPYITAPDSVKVGEEFSLNSDESTLRDFDLEQYYWDFGDGNHIAGGQAVHKFDSAGTYRIILGGLSTPFGGGVSRTCAYKSVHVVNDIIIHNLPEAQPEFLPLQTLGIGQIAHNTVAELKKKKYYVEFKKSPDQLALNDPFFEKVNYEITERFVPQDSSFRYSVGEADEISKLYQIYQELVDSGYQNTLVKEEVVKTFDDEVRRRGYYYPDSVKAAMNREINRFADIHFDYNSQSIKKESLANLDYIAKVLKAEVTLRLSIAAHTDNKGGDDFNLELSNERALAVVQYLEKRGVDRSRLEWKGFGNASPIASNENEDGRALNRRVEFELLFEEIMND